MQYLPVCQVKSLATVSTPIECFSCPVCDGSTWFIEVESHAPVCSFCGYWPGCEDG